MRKAKEDVIVGETGLRIINIPSFLRHELCKHRRSSTKYQHTYSLKR